MASATATKRAEIRRPGPKHNIEAMRQEYYERIAKHDMTPLWTVMSSVVTKEPVTHCAPTIWHYDDIKRLVMESGGLITAEEAERRVPRRTRRSCRRWRGNARPESLSGTAPGGRP